MSQIDSVLLVSFGGPEGRDDVIPFLENVTRGRGIPPERLASVAEHYYEFDGVSPINQQNRELIAALRAELDARAIDVPIYWGNRNWFPFIDEALGELHEAGRSRPLAITTSAYSSYSGCRQYRENIATALTSTGFEDVRITKAPAYFDRVGFQRPFARGLDEALARLEADGVPTDDTVILFTTHSIPTSMADTSGDPSRGYGDGGAYVAQHLSAAQQVVALTAQERDCNVDALPAWQLVFQSRSGAPHIPWLEPDVNDALRSLPPTTKAVVIVPIGFISDHLEVVWDLDHEARATCDAQGLRMIRVSTPGTSPEFVAMLADLVDEAQRGLPRQCAANCCPAPVRPQGRPA